MFRRALLYVVLAFLHTRVLAQSSTDKDWGPCDTPSGKGYCMDISLCTGTAIHLPGYCPGPRGIQCCVPGGIDVAKVTGITVGAFSGVSSGLVLLTGFMFRERMVYNKLYMKLILVIAFCACIGSFSMVLGYPTVPGVCSLQGFLYMFFFRASWLWCLLLTIVLFQQLQSSRYILNFVQMNYVIWPINIAFQVAPLFDNDWYGLPPNFIGRGICSIGALLDKSAAPPENNLGWLSSVFFYPLCICCVGMIVMDVYLYFVLLPRFQSEKIEKLVTNIVAYPLGMFFLWMPTFLVLVSIQLDASVNKAKNIQFINEMLTNLAATFGFFLSVVFFWKSDESRQRWRLQFTRWGLCGKAKRKAMASVESISSIGMHEDDRKIETRAPSVNALRLSNTGENVFVDYDVTMSYQYTDEAEEAEASPTEYSRSARSSSAKRSSRTPSVLHIIPESDVIASDFEADGVYMQSEVRVLRPSEESRSRISSNASSGRLSRLMSFGRRSSAGSTGGSSVSSKSNGGASGASVQTTNSGSTIPSRLSAAVEAPDGHERDSVL